MESFLTNEIREFEGEKKPEAGAYLSSFIPNDTIVGDLLSLNYNNAVILVHDKLRQEVGGLPMGCFLLASRIKPKEAMDIEREDTALIFLRVIGNAPLANNAEMETYRLAAGLRATGTSEEWDSTDKTDQFTLNQLRHAGVGCSVLGTFRMKKHDESWKLAFGADISNFYSGQGMKVYKPKGDVLKQVVNYTKPTGKRHDLAGYPVHIGHVRYSSSETTRAEEIHVDVGLEPTDLLARRTALFGMSRSGKSNTIKIIASSVFKLREHHKKGGRVGQLIFDVNGEYCNTNPQDDAGCLRNIKRDKPEDVKTYGLFKHPNDPGRNLLKTNFMGNEPQNWMNQEQVINAMASLVAGKEMINAELEGAETLFVKAFVDTPLDVPSGTGKEWNKSMETRYRRAIIAYRSILVTAGFEPAQSNANIGGLFGKDLREAFEESGHAESAQILGGKSATWDDLKIALSDLQQFIKQVSNSNSSDNDKRKIVNKWADDTIKGILSLYDRSTGPQRLRSLKERHSAASTKDYSDQIADDIRDGKLVIVDGSIGSEKLIRYTSERIMGAVFRAQRHDFVEPDFDEEGKIIPPPDVVVYVEEAHNILPKKGELTDLWPRIAKEGSKFHIGMVFSTQEPSSIMSNILKNTDNWFVAHLNNKDEVRELEKYYDFGEFVNQILKVPDTGFLRMRCLSNPYIVPVQVKEFDAPKAPSSTKNSEKKQ